MQINKVFPLLVLLLNGDCCKARELLPCSAQARSSCLSRCYSGLATTAAPNITSCQEFCHFAGCSEERLLETTDGEGEQTVKDGETEQEDPPPDRDDGDGESNTKDGEEGSPPDGDNVTDDGSETGNGSEGNNKPPDGSTLPPPPPTNACQHVKVTACDDTLSCPRTRSRSGKYKLYTGDCGERAHSDYPVYCRQGDDCGSSTARYLFFSKFDSERQQGVWYLQDGGLCGVRGDNSFFNTFISIIYASAERGLDEENDGTIACTCSGQDDFSRSTQILTVDCLDNNSSGGTEGPGPGSRGSMRSISTAVFWAIAAAFSLSYFVNLA